MSKKTETARDTQRLTDGLQRGEADAQEEFLRQYAPHAFRLIVQITANTQDAEELTQDTLLRAMQQIQRYDPQQASLETWVKHIAYRLTLNHLRKRPAPLLTLDSDDELFTEAEEEALQRAFAEADDERTELLQQALDDLPPDELTLINLFYYEDLPLAEIAFITEAPPGTVATRLHRIRKKLYHLILKQQQQ